ncbi:MAG: phosphoribosylanthranilate isomerase [Candidatus Rokubacteria bacterium]|nr:phosphoribosylanthranilate isomerase [Candidatus Rokubacteria bacterium]MBI2156780.1 phosphoribosylanthranilate isomerase [Candidatus Rokubacteria bacterium]
MMRVKVCGITSPEDALVAVEAGADALGFIFVEGTPRFVAPERAAAIIRELPPFVTPVGVFWDHPAGHVKAVAEACGLRALQFHGDEAPEDVTRHALPAIKTIKVSGPVDGARLARYRVAAFLLDSAERWSEGEARRPIEWALAREIGRRHRVILSAGLTPDNVAEAIAAARPYAVDVNSGVEAAPGRKDPDRVRRFVAAAKGTAWP